MNTCPDKADADDTASGAVAFNSAEKGSSGLPMHTLYLGSRRRRGFGEEELSRIGNLVVEEFGSFTMFPAAGFYRGKTLPSLVIKIGARSTDVVRCTAKKLGRLLEQEAVGLEFDGLYHRILMEVEYMVLPVHGFSVTTLTFAMHIDKNI